MTDIAQLGFAIDSEPARRATATLEGLSNAAKRAEGITGVLKNAFARLEAALMSIDKSVKGVETAILGLGRSTGAAEAKVVDLGATVGRATGQMQQLSATGAKVSFSFDAVAVSANKAAVAVNKEAAVSTAAATAARSHAEALTVEAMAAKQAANSLAATQAASKLAAFQQRNLAFQLNDVFVSLASGMNPLMVAIQQGSQIATIYGPEEGGIGRAFKETAALATNLISRIAPIAGLLAGVYGAYRLLQSYSAGAAVSVDASTAALAAQAAPIDTVATKIGELEKLQETYSDAIGNTATSQASATAIILANTEKEFSAKKSLLELELKRQQASIAAQKAELAIVGGQLKSEVGSSVFTNMNTDASGFSDPRVGRLVNLPDSITGLSKTQEVLANSALSDKITELRANLDLTEVSTSKLQEALATNFDASTTGAAKAAEALGKVGGAATRAANAAGSAAKSAADPWNGLRTAVEQTVPVFDGVREVARGFVQEFTDGLARGESVWASFASSAKNALSKIADAIVSSGIDALFGGGASGGSATGGILSGIAAGIFGGGALGSFPAAPSAGLYADGGVFDPSGAIPFAKGAAFANSIVSKPTVFPFANGIGLMGEAGPEAIMPLQRGPNGRLGVVTYDRPMSQNRGSSAKRGQTDHNPKGSGDTIINHFHIETPNPKAFAESRSTVARAAGRLVTRSGRYS